MDDSNSSKGRLRFAVVGLGYISQIAVLPAFANAGESCELSALVSGDPEKLEVLGKKYDVGSLYTYDNYEECLRSGQIDAVYIALPNSMHCDFTVRAAEAGIHVLCEKPMAVSEDECRRMIEACDAHDVRLMIAYRLHFEETNLRAVEMIESGKLGDPQIFNSTFSMQVRDGDIRTRADLGGGALFDIGVYCINAARYIFKGEPRSVSAIVSNPPDERFKEVIGLCGALLDFGSGRLASFVASFGAFDHSAFEVIGTSGSLKVSPAYDFGNELAYELNAGGKIARKTFERRDQFAPELLRFAECVQSGRNPEPSGVEGLADVRIIEAITRSASEGRRIELTPFEKDQRPDRVQEMHKPAVDKPRLFHAQPPTRES